MPTILFSSRLRASLASLLCGLIAFGAPLLAAEKQLLVVTVTKGFRHGSIPTAEAVLAGLAERHEAFAVDFARTDEELAEKLAPAKLSRLDGVIFANTTGELPIPDKDAFMKWIASGKGFVGMHSATDTFHQYRPYIEMIGGEFQTHGAQVEVDAVNEDPDHSSCAHYGGHFKIHDEIYIMKSFRRDRVHGLLTLFHHPNSRQPGDYPIAWCRKHGQGKVFYTSLGHREDVWTNADYQQHILGGILWSLGLAPGDADPVDPTYVLDEAEKKAGFRPLFNGVDLTGWKLRKPDGKASWSVQNGVLVNGVAKGEHGTDLISEEKFWNFTVRYQYQVPKDSNSGFYLRGRHEIQILGNKQRNTGGDGAIYGLKAPDLAVTRQPGQWQDVEATIRGNKVTVVLNGAKIHDAVEVDRATGSELDGNVDQPGAFMLQGDHGAVAFRHLRIKPLD